MKFDASWAGFILSFVGALSGWIAWWLTKLKFEKHETTQAAVAAAEKALNDERDFNHLVRNQQEISKNITYCFDGIEDQLNHQDRELQEIKAYLIAYGIASTTKALREKDSH